MLTAWGRLVHRVRHLVLALSALLLGLSVFALSRGGRLTTGTIEGIESERGSLLVEQALGERAGPSMIAIFSSNAITTEDPAFLAAMGHALAPLAGDPDIAYVVSPVGVPPQVGEKLISADRHSAMAQIVLKGDDFTADQHYDAVREKIVPGALTVAYTGTLPYRHDLDATLDRDLRLAELVSLPLTLLVLLFVFRSAVAAVLPVAVGGLSVMSGVASVLLLSRHMDMPKYAINVTTLIGLGVAIDYSLFYTSRFREELRAGAAPGEAVARAMGTAGRAVAFSGMAVGIGLAGLLFFPRSYLAAMGVAGALVVLFSVGFALTFLPALLGVLGKRVDAGALPFRQSAPAGQVWRRLAPWVMKRPLRVLLPALALLVALGTPFFRLRMATPSIAILPKTTEARATYEKMKRDFPAQAATRIIVVAHFPTEGIDEARAHAIRALRDRLRALPGVTGVESVLDFDPTLSAVVADRLLALPPEQRPDGVTAALQSTTGDGSTVLDVLTDAGQQSDAARDLVRTIREDRRVGAGGTLYVTGHPANDVDSIAFFRAHTPAAAAFVMTLTYLVLFLLLRSALLPLKAVVMNLLSISASFGALVWVFQEGHGASLLNFEPGPVDPTLPLLLFCVVFGLSMDYEVLLLTRIQEEYIRGHDNRDAVTEGLSRSGRLITSAAAIMVVVFGAFSLASMLMVKAMGTGMAVAVAVDATLVRLLIVPATMRLFGDLNWWAPRWLARLRLRGISPAG
jgi:uncharacterized membrane protein YdfJ with MMPL/SSD domain